jgi:hypothetical protein
VRCFDDPQPAVKTPNCHLTCEKSNENISTAGVLTFRLCTEYLSPVGFSFFNVALRRHRCRRSTMRHKTASVSTAKPDKSSLQLTEELIRVRAYQLYEERGCKGGHHLEDWLRVEAEIVGKKPAAVRSERSPNA